MKKIGFIYIMSNPAYPGDLKIGQTGKDPENRRKELGSATGVLGEFVLEYRALSEEYESLEREIHRSLASVRVSPKKEFFTISVPEAIDKIREVAGSRIESDKVFYVSPEELQRIKDEKQRKAQEEIEKRQKIVEESKKREQETKKRKLKERERKFAVMAETRKKQAEEELEKKRQYNRIHRRLLRVMFFPLKVMFFPYKWAWNAIDTGLFWRGFLGFILTIPWTFLMGMLISIVIDFFYSFMA